MATIICPIDNLDFSKCPHSTRDMEDWNKGCVKCGASLEPINRDRHMTWHTNGKV